MRENDEYLSAGDEWLKKYTFDSVNIAPELVVLEDLLARHPYQGGVLYRGLNFETKEHWDRFLERSKNGTVYESGGISSWTPAEGVAYNFAVTRPTYFLDRDLMRAEQKKREDVDHMIGHAGVILEVTAGPNVAIDVSKSRFQKENEVILPPGTYSMKIRRLVRPFMESINEDNFRNEFLSIRSLQDGGEVAIKYAHILNRFTDLDDQMREHLFMLANSHNSEMTARVVRDDRTDTVTGDYRNKIPSISIDWQVPSDFIDHYDKFLPHHRTQVDTYLTKLSDQLDEQFMEIVKDIDWKSKHFYLDINPSVQAAIASGRIAPKFIPVINDGIAAFYKHQNSSDALAAIDDMSKARSHAKLMQHALSQMIAMPKKGLIERAIAARKVIDELQPRKRKSKSPSL